jgi:hypothetical protein
MRRDLNHTATFCLLFTFYYFYEETHYNKRADKC